MFAVVSMGPIYLFGIPSGNDQSQHYQFAWTVFESVRSGDIYPSFAAETNHGFGDYGLRFYPPLTYYVLAGLRTLTGDWYAATLIALTAVFFAGAWGVYLWTRDLFGGREALIAAALYTFVPYHLNEIYNNFLLAEFFATAALPWCILYLRRMLEKPGLTTLLPFAAGCSVLVLTHLPMTILGGIALAVYALLLLRKEAAVRQLEFLALGGLSVMLLTSFYWSRWITELPWITHNSERYFSTTWDYRTNFLLVPSHWSDFGSDALNLWFADLMLVAGLLIVVPGLVLFFRGERERYKLLPVIVIFAAAALLTTPLSKPLWDWIALLQKVQFPWRWLAIVSAAGAVVGARGLTSISEQLTSKGRSTVALIAALACALVAFMAVTIVRGPAYVPRERLNADIRTFSDSTGCDCWWPVWARSEAFGQAEQVRAAGREIDITKWSATEREFSILPGPASPAAIKTWYYPRWTATVNGSPAQTRPDPNGVLTLDVPPSTANVVVRFTEPTYVRIAAIVSLIAWSAMAFSLAAMLLKSRRRRTSPTPETS